VSKEQRVYCRKCNGWMIEFDGPAFEVVRRRDKVRVSYSNDIPTTRTPEGRFQFVDPVPWETIVYDWRRDRATAYAWPEADGPVPSPTPTWNCIEVRCRCGAGWRFRRPT